MRIHCINVHVTVKMGLQKRLLENHFSLLFKQEKKKERNNNKKTHHRLLWKMFLVVFIITVIKSDLKSRRNLERCLVQNEEETLINTAWLNAISL